MIIISSCYYDKEELLYPVTENVCDTTNFTYGVKVSEIINSNCLACHGNSVYTIAGGGINLDGYSNLKAFVDNGKLIGSINHEQGFSPMPKNGGKLSECDISIIELWINSGSPDN